MILARKYKFLETLNISDYIYVSVVLRLCMYFQYIWNLIFSFRMSSKLDVR